MIWCLIRACKSLCAYHQLNNIIQVVLNMASNPGNKLNMTVWAEIFVSSTIKSNVIAYKRCRREVLDLVLLLHHKSISYAERASCDDPNEVIRESFHTNRIYPSCPIIFKCKSRKQYLEKIGLNMVKLEERHQLHTAQENILLTYRLNNYLRV